MQTREIHRIVVKPEAQKRIDQGRCPSCGLPKEKWKRSTTWRCCSAACTQKYWEEMVIANGWEDLRSKCFKRDQWTCQECGHQIALIKVINKESLKKWYNEDNKKALETYIHTYHGPDIIFIKENKTSYEVTLPNPTELIADHIVPISIGGEQWNPNNIQTLCQDCNKQKTHFDAHVIAEFRRKEKGIPEKKDARALHKTLDHY